MLIKTTLIAAAAVMMALPALAQNQPSGKVAPIETTAEAKALIGAPLDTSLSGAGADPQGDTGPLYVIEGNNMKPAAEWTEADKKACDAAGGIELPISAGRIACIRL